MYKFLFAVLCFQMVLTFSYAQDKEKLISNQSLLIDALREEQIGHAEKAIEILEKLKFEPDCKGVSNYYLAKLYRSNGKTNEAFEAIEQSVITEPDNTWYLLLQANMNEENGRIPEAAQTYEKLSALEINNFSHFDNAAYYYLKAENFKKALEVLNKAENIFGLIPSLAIKKSYVLNFLKKNKQATEVLETCYSQFPTNKDVLLELIKTYSELNNPAQATKYIEKLKQIDPKNEELSRWISNQSKTPIKDQNKSPDEVIQSPDANLDDKIKFLFAKLNVFVSRSDKSGIQSLLTPAQNLRKQFPADPKTIAFIGDIHFQLNDLLQAKEAYVQSIRDGQVPYSVWDNLLFCLIHLNHWKTANYISQKCIDLYPNQSFPSYVYILSKYKLNQLEDILPFVEQLELMVSYNDHKKTEVLILKAKILSALKNEEESTRTWKLAMETDHDYLAALEYCVFMAIKNVEYPKDYFNKAMLSEFIHESFKLDKAAELFYYSKDYNRAKQYIENSIAKGYCESADTLLLASKIFESLGDTNSAREFNKKAMALRDNESIEQIQQNFQLK